MINLPMVSGLFADTTSAAMAVELLVPLGLCSHDFTVLLTEPNPAYAFDAPADWSAAQDGCTIQTVRRLADAIAIATPGAMLAPTGVCLMIGDGVLAILAGSRGGVAALDIAGAFLGDSMRSRRHPRLADTLERGGALIAAEIGERFNSRIRRVFSIAGAMEIHGAA